MADSPDIEEMEAELDQVIAEKEDEAASPKAETAPDFSKMSIRHRGDEKLPYTARGDFEMPRVKPSTVKELQKSGGINTHFLAASWRNNFQVHQDKVKNAKPVMKIEAPIKLPGPTGQNKTRRQEYNARYDFELHLFYHRKALADAKPHVDTTLRTSHPGRQLDVVNDQMREIQLQKHRQRVENMKGMVDNTPPAAGTHIKNKAKKLMQLKERERVITKENMRLMESCFKVMERPSQYAWEQTQSFGNANSTRRAEERDRIIAQNERFLDRLLNVKSTMDHKSDEKQYQVQKKIIRPRDFTVHPVGHGIGRVWISSDGAQTARGVSGEVIGRKKTVVESPKEKKPKGAFQDKDKMEEIRKKLDLETYSKLVQKRLAQQDLDEEERVKLYEERMKEMEKFINGENDDEGEPSGFFTYLFPTEEDKKRVKEREEKEKNKEIMQRRAMERRRRQREEMRKKAEEEELKRKQKLQEWEWEHMAHEDDVCHRWNEVIRQEEREQKKHEAMMATRSDALLRGGEIGNYESGPKEKAILTVHVKDARNLIAMDANGKSDPYCVIKLGTESAKTSVKYKTLYPQWFEDFQLVYTGLANQLKFAVYDFDKSQKSDIIGKCEIDLSTLVPGSTHETWMHLVGVPKGEIRVAVTMPPEELIPSLVQRHTPSTASDSEDSERQTKRRQKSSGNNYKARRVVLYKNLSLFKGDESAVTEKSPERKVRAPESNAGLDGKETYSEPYLV